MRVKTEMDYKTFQLIRDAITDAQINSRVMLSRYNLSDFMRRETIKNLELLAVAKDRLTQSQVD